MTELRPYIRAHYRQVGQKGQVSPEVAEANPVPGTARASNGIVIASDARTYEAKRVTPKKTKSKRKTKL